MNTRTFRFAHGADRTARLILSLCTVLWLSSCSQREGLQITANVQQIDMGRTVQIEASYTPSQGDSVREVILMPYVNGRRWGSHEFPDSNGRALLLLPLPNVGTAEIEVVAVPRDTSLWCGLKDYRPYLTGRPMLNAGLHSNKIDVDVRRRDIPQRPEHPTAFVSQWEPWFAPGSMWTTAQAVPLVGFYDFTDPDVIRQHLLWLMDSGADAVLFDWSNHIWDCKHWDERGDGVNAIVHNTELALEVMADMRDEGLPVPQAIIMPGLSNGPPATMEALNEELNWIYQYMVRNPRFKGLWYEYDGKPLTVILDTGAMGVKEGKTETAFRVPFFKQTLGWTAEQIDDLRRRNPPVDSSRFTIRWMSSQNQLTGHDKLGYWSWMDGSLKPTVTYKGDVADGQSGLFRRKRLEGARSMGPPGRMDIPRIVQNRPRTPSAHGNVAPIQRIYRSGIARVRAGQGYFRGQLQRRIQRRLRTGIADGPRIPRRQRRMGFLLPEPDPGAGRYLQRAGGRCYRHGRSARSL